MVTGSYVVYMRYCSDYCCALLLYTVLTAYDPSPAYDPPPTSNVPPAAVAASFPSIGTNTTVSSSGKDSYMRMQCIRNQAIRLEHLQSQAKQM